MKTKSIAAVVVVFGLFIALYAQQASQKTTGVQRYQLVSAQVEDNISQETSQTHHVVFLLDTQTGEVFRYQSAFSKKEPGSNKELIIPDIFYSINRTKTNYENRQ